MALRENFGSRQVLFALLCVGLFPTLSGCSLVGGFGEFSENSGLGGASDPGAAGGTDGEGGNGAASGSGGEEGGTDPGPTTPQLSCTQQGEPFDLLSNADLPFTVLPGDRYDFDADSGRITYRLIPSNDSERVAFVVAEVTGPGGSALVARGISASHLDDLEPLALHTEDAVRIQAARYQDDVLEVFGIGRNAMDEDTIHRWAFEPDNMDSDILKPTESTAIVLLPCAPERIGFDVSESEVHYALVCRNEPEIWSLRLSDDLTTEVATGAAGDSSLNIDGYVRNGEQHLIRGEFTQNVRVGLVSELGEPISLQFDADLEAGEVDERQFHMVDVVELGDEIFFTGLATDGEPTMSPGTYRSGVLPNTGELRSLFDSPPLDLLTDISFEATPPALPSRGILGETFVALASQGLLDSKKIFFSLYARNGAIAVNNFEVSQVPDGAEVDRVRATPIHNLLGDTLVTWAQRTADGTTLRAQYLQCR